MTDTDTQDTGQPCPCGCGATIADVVGGTAPKGRGAADTGRARTAAALLADVFGDGMLAMQVGPHLTCNETDSVASALILLGEREAAATLIAGHATEESHGDSHMFDTETVDAIEDAARAYADNLAQELGVV